MLRIGTAGFFFVLMKLLFDENISHNLPVLVAETYPNSSHVRNCHLTGATDHEIWQYAQEHGYVVVTKDSDFHDRALLRRSPPKVIWLRLGNCSTKTIQKLLDRHASDIANFEESDADILTLS